MGWPDEPFLNLRQTATPQGTAPNGGQLVYVKSDGKLYTKIAGVETVLGAGGDVTLAGVQTLTNKTVALGSNTVSGTTAQFNTALSDNDFATLAGTETLTNKTLTSATFLAGTLTQLPPIRCTSATRPAHNAGQVIIETDTTKVYVSNGTTWLLVYEDTGWTAPTLAGTWVNFGAPYQNVRYRRTNGIVYVQGVIKNGTINTAAFTLPAGFRPLATVMFASVSADAIARLEVSSTGVITPVVGSTTWFDITCSYPADA